MQIRNKVSTFWAIALLLLSLGLAIALQFGARIEDLHFLFFPVLLLAVWRLPRAKEFRIPIPLLGLATVLWLGSAAFVEGLIPGSVSIRSPFIARLAGDRDGLLARGLFVRCNEIARTYHLPTMELARRSFHSEADARHWLEARSPSPFLLLGDTKWQRVVLSRKPRRYLALLIDSLGTELQAEEVEALRSWKLDPAKNSLLFRAPGIPAPLVLTYQVDSVALPGEPSELGRHWLMWLAAGLLPEEQPNRLNHAEAARALFSAKRIDALLEASLISGPWKSHEPLAFSDYLLGTVRLLEAIASGSAGSSFALEDFRRAAGQIDSRTSPALHAAIFNNAAVAQLLLAENSEDLSRAKRWLAIAADTPLRKATETAPQPQRAALYNLSILSGAGVFQ